MSLYDPNHHVTSDTSLSQYWKLFMHAYSPFGTFTQDVLSWVCAWFQTVHCFHSWLVYDAKGHFLKPSIVFFSFFSKVRWSHRGPSAAQMDHQILFLAEPFSVMALIGEQISTGLLSVLTSAASSTLPSFLLLLPPPPPILPPSFHHPLLSPRAFCLKLFKVIEFLAHPPQCGRRGDQRLPIPAWL